MIKHRLSTHAIRRRARAARKHYKRIQVEAAAGVPAAIAAAHDLKIKPGAAIEVEPSVHERAKWRVVVIEPSA